MRPALAVDVQGLGALAVEGQLLGVVARPALAVDVQGLGAVGLAVEV